MLCASFVVQSSNGTCLVQALILASESSGRVEKRKRWKELSWGGEMEQLWELLKRVTKLEKSWDGFKRAETRWSQLKRDEAKWRRTQRTELRSCVRLRGSSYRQFFFFRIQKHKTGNFREPACPGFTCMKIMFVLAGNLRCNFSTYLSISLQNPVPVPCTLLPLPESMQAFPTCNVLPVSHILQGKVLMEQRSEITQKKYFLFFVNIFFRSHSFSQTQNNWSTKQR